MLRIKDYLSWSQYSTWKGSKRSYWKQYGPLNEKFDNAAFGKGRELAEALEYGPDGLSVDPMLKAVLLKIPKLDIMEDKFEVELSNGEKIMGYTDSINIENDEFLEYKTGKIPWDQKKVDKHGQLPFYALGYWIKSGRTVVPKCKLIWVETEHDEEGNITYNGEIHEFERGFLVSELIDLEKELIKTIIEIEAWEYVEMELSESVVERYIRVQNEIKELEGELDLIKLEVKVKMEMDEVDYAASTKGRFSFTTRKSWKYSDECVEVTKRAKSIVDKAKRLDVKEGKATYTESKSLAFRLIKQ